MEQKRPIPTERLRTIRGQMVERFSLDELRDLTFELGVDWDQLSGNNKSAKTTELLELLNRRTQLPALMAQLQTLRLDAAWALDDLDESAEPPYKGLAFFDATDADLFFGREQLSATLIDAVRRQSFLAVVGASGSGKSSVVRAGVVPALRGDRPPPNGAELPRDCRNWAYLELTPTDRPLEQLALALTQDLDTVGETRAIIRDLTEEPSAVHLYLCKYLERQRHRHAFVLVDQFEELFTACKDEAARVAFIDGLLAVVEGGKTTVVITLRADFYHHCLRYAGFRDALQQHQQLIGAMSEVELREVVELPAFRTGYELEPGLGDLIVRDTGHEDGSLPLLSHALLETWRRREGRWLTHFGYQQAGGVGGAIAKTADRAYGDLDPARQAVARRIFLQLTELGEGVEDTRRRVALADLLPGDGAERAEAEAVLDALAQARLVTTDDVAAQVTHEAIIREWPALREWLRDELEALRLERRLAAAATEWDDGGRDPSYLYDGAQLAAARQWADTNPTSVTGTVCAFLDAATAEEGRKAVERERTQAEQLAQARRLAQEATERERAQARATRTFRRAVIVALVLTVLAGVAAVLAVLQGREAKTAAAAAVVSKGTAVAAQSTTAYEATRAEVNLNEAVAARATSDYNESQAKIERDNTVTASNDSRARFLLYQSERVFDSDPLLADRLLLEAMAISGETTTQEAFDALSANLLSGQTVMPITETVSDFVEVKTAGGTQFIADYQLRNDVLISGATGDIVAPLNGHVSDVMDWTHPSFFIVQYSDVNTPDELRRMEEIEKVFPLNGEVNEVFTFPNDNPFFVIDYYDAPGELRNTDNLEQVVPLNAEVYNVIALPDSPFFVVNYSDAPGELRQTEDIEHVVRLSGDIGVVHTTDDSPFFVVDYSFVPDELRQTEDIEQVIPLNGEVEFFYRLPDSPFFVIDYDGTPGELRHMENFEQAVPLNGDVDLTVLLSNSPLFIIRYADAPSELRQTENIEQVVPLNGEVDDVTSLLNSPIYAVNYYDAPSELRQTEDIEQVVPINGHVDGLTALPDSPFFVVNYSDAPGELRQTEDIEQVIPLSGLIYDVTPLRNSPYFVVNYYDAPGELRRMEAVEQVIPLNGDVQDISPFLTDNSLIAVDYYDAPGELRWAADIEQIVPLNGQVDDIIHLYGMPFFVVDYSDALSELRRTDTGEVVTDGSGQRLAESADILSFDLGYYWITFQDGTSGIDFGNRVRADLGPGVAQPFYFPETNRVAVRYADGRVIYIDLTLIEALGGPDAAETLAAMSPEELIAFTCETLFTDNPDWDEAKLEEYLVFLPDGKPRACRV